MKKNLLKLTFLSLICFSVQLNGYSLLTEKVVDKLSESLTKKSPVEIKKIAILHILDATGTITPKEIKSIKENFAIKITNQRRFEHVEREMLDKILDEQNYNLKSFIEPNKMKNFGKISGIDGMLEIKILYTSRIEKLPSDLQDSFIVLLYKLYSFSTATVAACDYLEIVESEKLKPLLDKHKEALSHSKDVYFELADKIASDLKINNLSEKGINTISILSERFVNDSNQSFNMINFLDAMAYEITNKTPYRIVDRSFLDKYLSAEEKRLAEEGLLEPEAKEKLRKQLGIDGFIFGTIISSGTNEIQLRLRLIDTETGVDAWGGKFTGENYIFQLNEKLTPLPPTPIPTPEEPKRSVLPIPTPLITPNPPQKRSPRTIPTPPKPDEPKYKPYPDSSAPQFRVPSEPGIATYVIFGFPRDLFDFCWMITDRIPFVGGVSTALYSYSGPSLITRSFLGEYWKEIYEDREILTWGQIDSEDEWVTPFPVANSFDKDNNMAAYVFLGFFVFDIYDGCFILIDRVPIVGAVSYLGLAPLDSLIRILCERGYIEEISPVKGKVTLGGLRSNDKWSIFPNFKSWTFWRVSKKKYNLAKKEVEEENTKIKEEYEKKLEDWNKEVKEIERKNDTERTNVEKEYKEESEKWEKSCEEEKKKYNEQLKKTKEEQEKLDKEYEKKHEEWKREVEQIEEKNKKNKEKWEEEKNEITQYNNEINIINIFAKYLRDLSIYTIITY